jgi:hypothetical protein
MSRGLPTFFLLALLAPIALPAQGFIETEGGVAFTGYNDVRIPSDSGTTISLKDDIESNPALALRMRIGYTFARRHTVMFLAAPLTVRGSGTLGRDVEYQGVTFPAGTKLRSQYRFDSYRLAYRYRLVDGDSLRLDLGLAGKIRSADIAIMSDDAYAHRQDLGFVPLITAMASWRFAAPFSVLLDADGLVTPFGRAEDALLALQYHPSESATLRLGYRILEGGSDGGGKVYTFSAFHYLVAGISVAF